MSDWRPLIFLSLIVATSFASGKTNVSTRYEKGFFSAGLLIGSAEASVLNQDATESSFSGFAHGLDLEISISPLLGADIRFFGNLIREDLKQKDSVYKLRSQSSFVGLKFYANDYLHLSLGLGTSEQKLESDSNTVSLNNEALLGGLGFDYPITDSLAIGLTIYKTVNPIKDTANTSGNSFSESQQYFLKMTWSPPSTIINNVTNSGR